MPVIPKNIHATGLKKKSYKEFDNEKEFLWLENSSPPTHSFSNGPSLYEKDNLSNIYAGLI